MKKNKKRINWKRLIELLISLFAILAIGFIFVMGLIACIVVFGNII